MNKLRITLTSFLAYFVMSAVISPLGIVSAPIAGHYDIAVTTATAGFSSLTAGILVGTLVALVIFDLFRLKHTTPRREARHPDDGAGKYWPVEIFLLDAAILIYPTCPCSRSSK